MNQLFAAYSTGKDNKELMSILGEAALTPTDLLYAKFADEFERRFLAEGGEGGEAAACDGDAAATADRGAEGEGAR